MGVELPGGHHHSVKGVWMNEADDDESWILAMMISTRDRYCIPETSNSGALASTEQGSLGVLVTGILILTDPVVNDPPAIPDSVANLSRWRSCVADLNPLSSSGIILPEAIISACSSIPLWLFEDDPRTCALMNSKMESFLNGWRNPSGTLSAGSV